MITGLGFTEVLTILVLVLLFFGSKELPHFIREAGRMFARVRRYGEQVRRELDEVSRTVDTKAILEDSTPERKKQLRTRFITAREGLTPEQRTQFSARITTELLTLEEVKNARAVMAYLHTDDEVYTDTLIEQLQAAGVRVILPYCRQNSRDLGIANVHDINTQTAPGTYGIREPIAEFRDNFLKSDIDIVLCPGVAFDRGGTRLGRGGGYYDNFLRELDGRILFIGLAYGCQISDEPFPHDYHDVSVNQVITEEGPALSHPSETQSA